MTRLAGRKVVITGAASGIGRAITAAFAREGALLGLIDKDGVALDGARAAMPEAIAWTRTIDLQDLTGLPPCIAAAAARLNGLDGIVNAAGHHATARLEDTDDALWLRTLAVNLTAPMAIIRAALPFLRQATAATVVNIASGSALHPVPQRAAYIASKGGLVALTKALAQELAPGIRVNCICPGAVDTPMLRRDTPEALRAAIGAHYALGRVADPAEIADAALFLTGPESTYITGATLAVDGGRTYH